MNGAESLVHTFIKNGLNVCFANPGTSEMHFVAALDRIPGIRCVPGFRKMWLPVWRMAMVELRVSRQ